MCILESKKYSRYPVLELKARQKTRGVHNSVYLSPIKSHGVKFFEVAIILFTLFWCRQRMRVDEVLIFKCVNGDVTLIGLRLRNAYTFSGAAPKQFAPIRSILCI